ncbi:MAG: RluA family pseudouridine synthase [Clostridiales Family XIII bacterium]|nr:RluA family pseudouridine synthase [Clostridiales Family XIII bacterium]
MTKEDEVFKVREILKRRLALSSRLMRKLKDRGGVTVNGAGVKLNSKLKAGGLLAVRFPEEISGFEPEPIPISVIYEDDDLLIIDKQAGFVVHPTKGHPAHTVANGVMHHMLERGEAYRIRFINRLDMDTTGVLLVGKNSYSQHSFARQAARNAGKDSVNAEGDVEGNESAVEKKYLAVVNGAITEEEGAVNLPIGKEDEDRVKRAVLAGGHPATTRYRVLERFSGAYTLLELVIETGRTHQIRVHMAHIGHSVVGDALYGRSSPKLIERQALHAASLSFPHPRTGKTMKAEAPLPEDIERLLQRLRSH